MDVESRGRAVRWHERDRLGVRLACADLGGKGKPVVLLHGLAGHALEWRETASWLTERHRVIAPEARGHGRSERHPGDLSRAAQVADVEMWIEHFDCGPVVLVGQSLGGHTAFLVASARPDLVAKLVIVEASPDANPGVAERIRESLTRWPVPFASRDAALAFFGRNRAWAEAWADGLEQREDGLWPSFEIDVMVDSVSECATVSYRDELRSITCPTLVVVTEENAAGEGVTRMLDNPHASLIVVPDAGHDLHLDNPRAWREAFEPFAAR